MRQLNVIDLFCGAGGLSYGFSKTGFNILAANDNVPDAAIAFSLNHPQSIVYLGDIKNLNTGELLNDLDLEAKDIDIVIGGPPCQAYSTVGKRLMSDPRATLFQEYFRILKELQPKFFIFENVKGLLSMQKGQLILNIIALFQSLGYKVNHKVLNAADYGVPQIRERVIIAGTKFNTQFKFPNATHSPVSNKNKKPYLTVEDAISDLPLIGTNQESDSYLSPPVTNFQRMMRSKKANLSGHVSPNNNPRLIKIMELLPDGGSPADIPEIYRPKSGFKNTYCRLWWKKPSTTITRNLGTPSSSRCIHPKAPRPLTTREGARLQSFPDDYIFYGSRSAQNLQIGEAVPPLLSIAIARSVKKHFEENRSQWISLVEKSVVKSCPEFGLKILNSSQLDLKFSEGQD